MIRKWLLIWFLFLLIPIPTALCCSSCSVLIIMVCELLFGNNYLSIHNIYFIFQFLSFKVKVITKWLLIWFLFLLIPIPTALCCSSRSVLICSPWDSTHIHHSLVFLLSFWQWNATIKLDNGTQQRNSEWNSTHIYHTFSCFPLHLLATCNPHAFGFGLVLS